MRIEVSYGANNFALYDGGVVLTRYNGIDLITVRADGKLFVAPILEREGASDPSTDGTHLCWVAHGNLFSISCSRLDGLLRIDAGDGVSAYGSCCTILRGDYVYWLNPIGEVRRARWDTGGPTTLVAGNGPKRSSLAMDGDRLLWLERAGDDGGIRLVTAPIPQDRAVADASNVATMAGLNAVLAVAPDAYYIAGEKGIYRVRKDADGGPAVLFVRGEPDLALAVDTSYAYYTSAYAVYRVSLDASIPDGGLIPGMVGGPVPIGYAENTSSKIGVDDHFVYWIESRGFTRLAK